MKRLVGTPKVIAEGVNKEVRDGKATGRESEVCDRAEDGRHLDRESREHRTWSE